MMRFLKRKRSDENGTKNSHKNKKRRISARHPHTPEQVKVLCWNVNGMKALQRFENGIVLRNLVEEESPHFLCIQESKLAATSENTFTFKYLVLGYEGYFHHCKRKKGYSGVITYVRNDVKVIKVMRRVGVKAIDEEGRLLIIETEDFFLMNTYVPNSGGELERLSFRVDTWDKTIFRVVEKLLGRKKDVIWCGDLNVTFNLQKDIWREGSILEKLPGCTKEERTSFTTFLEKNEMTDAFDFKHPSGKEKRYTHFSYKPNREIAIRENRGWRLDYFIVSKSLRDRISNCYICHDKNRTSDHIPIGLIFNRRTKDDDNLPIEVTCDKVEKEVINKEE